MEEEILSDPDNVAQHSEGEGSDSPRRLVGMDSTGVERTIWFFVWGERMLKSFPNPNQSDG